jgi:phosphatidylglycerol:prolipoprotein diacylglycerol transferase
MANFNLNKVILGGRLGYVLFYDLAAYLADPTEILRLWNGGMSFYGGLLGVVIASWLWGRRNGRTLVDILDFVAPLVPTGLFFGRIGNFINAELWGKVTESAFGMVFPGAGPLPRHPSQLYEAGLEGLLTFVILWIYSSRPRPRGSVAGLFAVLYSLSRMFVEFFRVPDAQIGYLFGGWFTMGQLLCLPLLAAGICLLFSARRTGRA